MPRGGKRAGAGRKPKAKIANVGKDVAGEVLDSIDQVQYWRFLLHADADLKTLNANQRESVASSLIYLTNRRHGKPAEALKLEVSGLDGLAERLASARKAK